MRAPRLASKVRAFSDAQVSGEDVAICVDGGAVYSRRLPWSKATRVQWLAHGARHYALVSTVVQGGSGRQVKHELLEIADGTATPVFRPGELDHSNMGGLFVGPLGRAARFGAARWEAVWGAETHYAPHRYTLVEYRIEGDRATRLKTVETPPVPAEPAAAPRSLHLPYRDVSPRPPG